MQIHCKWLMRISPNYILSGKFNLPSCSAIPPEVYVRTAINQINLNMSGFSSTLYNAVFKRTSTFALAIVTGGIFFERGFDHLSQIIFENVNKGKLWKDIKHKYEEK